MNTNTERNEIYIADVRASMQGVVGIEKLRGKRVLILGATGLIGSYITEVLLLANVEQDLDVTIYAVSRSRDKLIHRFGEETEQLHFIAADVQDLMNEGATLAMPERIDYIIHGASASHPAAFRESPVEVMMANLLGTRAVCELARKFSGCKVLFLSSGEAGQQVDHLTTRACYPMSKKAAETMCLSYEEEYDVDVRIARICHTFGAGLVQEDNKASSQFLRMAARGEDIVMHSRGEQRRSYAYVADVAAALLSVLTLGQRGELYEVAGDDVCSIYEFAVCCGENGGCRVRIEAADEIQQKEKSPMQNQIMDNTRIKQLGWKPQFTIGEGIAHALQCMQGKEI